MQSGMAKTGPRRHNSPGTNQVLLHQWDFQSIDTVCPAWSTQKMQKLAVHLAKVVWSWGPPCYTLGSPHFFSLHSLPKARPSAYSSGPYTPSTSGNSAPQWCTTGLLCIQCLLYVKQWTRQIRTLRTWHVMPNMGPHKAKWPPKQYAQVCLTPWE